MTNLERLMNDKEAVVHLINDRDNHFYDSITKWYCKNVCKSKSCEIVGHDCDIDLSSDELIRLYLDSECE